MSGDVQTQSGREHRRFLDCRDCRVAGACKVEKRFRERNCRSTSRICTKRSLNKGQIVRLRDNTKPGHRSLEKDACERYRQAEVEYKKLGNGASPTANPW